LVYRGDVPSSLGKGTWAGAGTIDTACPEAGAAPAPVAPPAGVLQAALIGGAAWATRPGAAPGAGMAPVVVGDVAAVVGVVDDVVTFLEVL
jgi:hypothetical protein